MKVHLKAVGRKLNVEFITQAIILIPSALGSSVSLQFIPGSFDHLLCLFPIWDGTRWVTENRRPERSRG